ncbi:hypothetical protein PTSG_10494 [Salpingoeca rosetta]|uniref:Sulfatase N-terminal domain-containing protein n=1 Tax=Salpingoeca rosetta (strain ATCC 50818 / BSB-021) TaxID=946362 RepID=F2UPU2_SALR5|nr:uncharacterized protein PTSG_10494 [Salpingoeca rosetta]EGD79647.1 hypothetical protein PTSG_10494 [Salpingoeca rosetta]|eukprot:XP_004988875.1 hypothetical protein PTSG_10494 [Salpingoeca rosetta]
MLTGKDDDDETQDDGGGGGTTARVDVLRKASIFFLLTDDQDVDMGFVSQPKLVSLWQKQGATLEAAFASTPVCCPSRAGIQTGRYIHNVPMTNNSIPGNCSSTAWQQGAERHNIGHLMKQAGYTTMYTGKYLNQYGAPSAGGVQHVPRGWDNWQALVGNSVYYDYVISNNGTPESHGNTYLPNLLLDKTSDFLRTLEGTDDPFFIMVGTPSCHDPTEPAPEYAHLLPNATAPRPPNYGKAFRDKHWFVAKQGEVAGFGSGYAPIEEKYNDLQYRRRALTLMTVDDIVANVTATLKSMGRLNNTYFFYASDHGYHLGNFAVLKDKRLPYETDLRIPAVVRGPHIKPGHVVRSPVTLVDFAPTFLDIAGAPIPDTMDGVSMLPVLTGQEADVRTDFLVEYHGEGQPPSSQRLPCLMHPPRWPHAPICSCQDAHNNTYECVRTLDRQNGLNTLYCEMESGFREFYNITGDPHQLVNAINTTEPTLIAQLARRLHALKQCKGPSCRQRHTAQHNPTS